MSTWVGERIVSKGTQLMISSWYYMYLLGKKPVGLPNEIFTRSPYSLLLFDKIFCDKNGYLAEERAHRVLGWTSSDLFLRLKKLNILVFDEDIESELKHNSKSFGRFPQNQIHWDEKNSMFPLEVENNHIFLWRTQVNRSFAFDYEKRYFNPNQFALIKEKEESFQENIGCVQLVPSNDIIQKEAPKIFSEFKTAQGFENEGPLQDLKRGVISQEEYLEIISKNQDAYNAFDQQLNKKNRIEDNWLKILDLREIISPLRDSLDTNLNELLNHEIAPSIFRRRLKRDMENQSKHLKNRIKSIRKREMKQFPINFGIHFIDHIVKIASGYALPIPSEMTEKNGKSNIYRQRLNEARSDNPLPVIRNAIHKLF